MYHKALYVYGIVKCGIDLELNDKSLTGKDVYLICKGKFGALAHECKEEAYMDENPEKVKDMIITHNRILDKAMADFGGVIPLSFNTIIKKGKSSARLNLKKWLKDDEERLEQLWNKVKSKKEYGIRVYYDKEKLLQEASTNKEIKKIEKNIEGKTPGLSYLLQGKVKSKKQELFQNKVNELKKEFYDKIKKAAEETVLSSSKIYLEEEKVLLLSLSVLVEEKQVVKIKEILREKEKEGLPFHLAGPFAPYSFVESR